MFGNWGSLWLFSPVVGSGSSVVGAFVLSVGSLLMFLSVGVSRGEGSPSSVIVGTSTHLTLAIRLGLGLWWSLLRVLVVCGMCWSGTGAVVVVVWCSCVLGCIMTSGSAFIHLTLGLRFLVLFLVCFLSIEFLKFPKFGHYWIIQFFKTGIV